MKAVWGLDDVVLPMVQAICELPRPFERAKALAFEHDGEIVGGIVFHNWTPESKIIEISVGAKNPRWLTRTILSEVARYAFDVCNCFTIMAQTPPDNPTARMWRFAGAEETSIPHLLGPGKPKSIFTLTRDQWQSSKFQVKHGTI